MRSDRRELRSRGDGMNHRAHTRSGLQAGPPAHQKHADISSLFGDARGHVVFQLPLTIATTEESRRKGPFIEKAPTASSSAAAVLNGALSGAGRLETNVTLLIVHPCFLQLRKLAEISQF
ncbi:unnamed protein product [Pleuronectes platessa]|uniref:Uncharacterized protein n=1 Tax=Pleuronectes platessa TaxID=8262 RepID=A0A9N7U6J7_PLEPL|nr:unnamed protein product [Pleuronectes platessa]